MKKGYRAISNTTANNSDRRTNAKGILYLQSIDTEYQRLPEYKEQLLILQTYEQQYLTWSQIKTEHEKAKQVFDSSFAIKQEKEHIIAQKQEQEYHTYKQLF